MLLSKRTDIFSIPHTSTCIIHTNGTIHDGDTIEISSPVFSSINFSTGAMNMSERFNVPIRILNESRSIENDGNITGTLVCDDNDVFGMYVRIL